MYFNILIWQKKHILNFITKNENLKEKKESCWSELTSFQADCSGIDYFHRLLMIKHRLFQSALNRHH